MQRRYWQWPQPFAWEPERTALVVIDMQRGFVTPGGPLSVPMAATQVPTIGRVLRAFRERDLPVVHTRFVVRDDWFVPFYRFRAPDRGIATGPHAPYHPDGEDAVIVDELAPLPDEPVIDKVAYDGFAETGLAGLLRSRGVDTLVMAGTVVNWCVDSTLRSAFHQRFQNIVLADGVSGYDHAGATGEQWVAQELDFFAESYAVVLDSDDLIAALDDPARRQVGVTGTPRS